MDFEALMQALMNPGEEGQSDSIYDDLSASYTNATSTRDAKIADSDALIASLNAELTAAKLVNYELMINQVAEKPEIGNDDGEADTEESDIGDDDDFFESEDKD